MSDVYRLADIALQQRVGNKLKAIRLKQNITQRSLAESAEVSLSTVKKIENGEIGSFGALLRILRILGRLDALQALIEEEPLSPNEYYELVHTARKKTRRRAVGRINTKEKETSAW
ncbi:MAG: helix-turn-helix domain-containing protein [Bacteroidales bacterium]|nr:helix-turn-helix domain-containing protein [Bacteroidales bacterium]